MTISNFRAHEPLFIVIIRSKTGEQALKDWVKLSNCQVSIEGNRMKIFDIQTLNRFQMDWPGDWESVIIWDTWNKRHIWFS